MAGGPSHLETFDPKPLLNRLHGQVRPAEFGEANYQFIQPDARLLGSARRFRQHGQSGIDVSDLFPHTARCVDELAVIRSCHGIAWFIRRPSTRCSPAGCCRAIRAWGRGSCMDWEAKARRCRVMSSCPIRTARSRRGCPCTPTASCRPCISRTLFHGSERPVRNLDLPPGVSPAERRRTIDLIQNLNRAGPDPRDEELDARIESYDWRFACKPRRPRSSTWRANRKQRSISTGSAGNRRTTMGGAACCPQADRKRRALHHRGRRRRPGNMQWDAHAGH